MRKIITKQESKPEESVKKTAKPIITTLKEGIYSIPDTVYHADPCPKPSLSSSIAKALRRSAFHAWLKHPRLNPEFEEEIKSTFDKGKASHKLLLEGDDSSFAIGYEFKDWRTNAAKDFKAEAYANGKIPMLEKDIEPFFKMRDVALKYIANTKHAGMFDRGKTEQTVIWQEQNGIWCRSRLDYLSDDRKMIIDYKTTPNAEPDSWSRKHIIQLGYDIQASFYSTGVYRLMGIMPEFVFLVQESEPPYQCSLVALEQIMETIGENKYMRAVKLWEECLKSGKFPSYSTDVQYYVAPTYEVFNDQDLEDNK